MSTPTDPTRPRGAWRLGSIAGVPLYLSSTWLLGVLGIFAIVMWQIAPLASDPVTSIGLAATVVVVLGVSVLIHESCHALAARAVGFVVCNILLTFWGGATSFAAYRPRPGTTALVGLAGPLANFVLAGAGALLLPLAGPGYPTSAVAAVVWINLALGIFNVLPGLPLDGGQAVAGLAWAMTGSHTTGIRVAAWTGRAVALGATAYLVLPQLASGSFDAVGIVWSLMIGVILWMWAGAALGNAKARAAFDAVPVARVAQPAVAISANAPLGLASQSAAGCAMVIMDGSRSVSVVAGVPLDPAYINQPVGHFGLPTIPRPVRLVADQPVTDAAIAMGTQRQTVIPVLLDGNLYILGMPDIEAAVTGGRG